MESFFNSSFFSDPDEVPHDSVFLDKVHLADESQAAVLLNGMMADLVGEDVVVADLVGEDLVGLRVRTLAGGCATSENISRQ